MAQQGVNARLATPEGLEALDGRASAAGLQDLATVAAAGNRKHKVTRGESLSGLARRYNTSVAALVRANDLSDENIRIGQVLTIPGS